SSTALFKLADLSQLELELHLPERDAAFVRVGAPVELSLVDQTQFVADVLRKAPVVDPLTGTVKLTVRATKFPAAAMPGAFVQARIEVERKRDVTSVPTPSTFELEGERFVFVANEDK